MRGAAKLWLILGGIHLLVWPAVLYAAFNRVDLRHLSFVCLFTVPLTQAVAMSSVARNEPWLKLGGSRAPLVLGLDALLCIAVLFGLDARAIAAAVVVKAIVLGARKRFLFAAAAVGVAVHIAFNVSDIATVSLGIRSDAIRWMIGFTLLNAALMIALFRDRTAGGAPLPAMLGYAIVLCNFFLHPFLTSPWTALAPTMYSVAFTFALAWDEGADR